MPIVSRTLTKLADRPDKGLGIMAWRIDAVDTRGRAHTRGPFQATEANAEIKRDAAVFDPAELDRQELLEFVQLGNTVAAFDFTNRDITEEEGEEHIYLTFAISDREIGLTLAWWLDTLNTGARNTISGRVGFTGVERGRIDQRYPPLVLALPWLDAVEADPNG